MPPGMPAAAPPSARDQQAVSDPPAHGAVVVRARLRGQPGSPAVIAARMAEIRAATNLTSNIIATLVVGRWVGGVDMTTATDELRTGFVEDEETQVPDTGHAGEPQKAG